MNTIPLQQTTESPDSFTPTIHRRLGPGDDLEMINSPHLWPWFPVLPVKNFQQIDPQTGTKPNVGVIVAQDPTVVRVGLMFIMDFKNAERQTYPSVEAMLADGWQVD